MGAPALINNESSASRCLIGAKDMEHKSLPTALVRITLWLSLSRQNIGCQREDLDHRSIEQITFFGLRRW